MSALVNYLDDRQLSLIVEVLLLRSQRFQSKEKDVENFRRYAKLTAAEKFLPKNEEV